jgi:hypothetical protein
MKYFYKDKKTFGITITFLTVILYGCVTSGSVYEITTLTKSGYILYDGFQSTNGNFYKYREQNKAPVWIQGEQAMYLYIQGESLKNILGYYEEVYVEISNSRKKYFFQTSDGEKIYIYDEYSSIGKGVNSYGFFYNVYPKSIAQNKIETRISQKKTIEVNNENLNRVASQRNESIVNRDAFNTYDDKYGYVSVEWFEKQLLAIQEANAKLEANTIYKGFEIFRLWAQVLDFAYAYYVRGIVVARKSAGNGTIIELDAGSGNVLEIYYPSNLNNAAMQFLSEQRPGVTLGALVLMKNEGRILYALYTNREVNKPTRNPARQFNAYDSDIHF